MNRWPNWLTDSRKLWLILLSSLLALGSGCTTHRIGVKADVECECGDIPRVACRLKGTDTALDAKSLPAPLQ